MTPDYKAALEWTEEKIKAFEDYDAASELFPLQEGSLVGWVENALELDVLKTIRLALTEAAGKQWQDIETAPRDGRYVLLCDGYRHVVRARFYKKEINGVNSPYQRGEGFWAESWDDKVYSPTHWMPLPASPTASSGGGE